MTVVLSALCLASQLSGLAHLALVPHVACAEHGELVELGHRGLGPGGLVQVGAAVRVQASPAPAELSQRHGHDHCVLAALRREPACLGAGPFALEARPLSQALPGSRSSAPPASALPVLAVAPKASPPAA
jgi:hypothetical protein